MNKLLLSSLLLTSSSLFAFGTSLSPYPLANKEKAISGNFIATFGSGAGVGFQGAYSQHIENHLKLDGGAAVLTGDRSAEVFGAADYEIFPDYENQPRFSVRTSYTFASQFDDKHSIVAIAPVVSKSLDLWGAQGYPYASLPLSLNLNIDHNTYYSQASLNFGLISKVPDAGWEKILVQVEVQAELKDSFSALYAGMTYLL